jgi:hypothetical protein
MHSRRSQQSVGRTKSSAIAAHAERLARLADLVGEAEPAELGSLLGRECAYLTRELQPLMAEVEAARYGRLDQLMAGRHSMQPMREEHANLRQLVQSLHGYCSGAKTDDVDGIGLRRVLYRLHTMLKLHLAEEERYLTVLDGSPADG